MKFFKDAFATLQKIGKSLMLPVSVLPVAGILLGVGSAKLSWLPAIVSNVMAQSGAAIFSNLPLIFAIGVALGLAKNDGVAALAAVVGYAVLQAALGVFAVALGIETKHHHGYQVYRDWCPRWHFNRRYRGSALQSLLQDSAATLPWLLCR